MRRLLLPALPLALLLAVAACSGEEAPEDDAGQAEDADSNAEAGTGGDPDAEALRAAGGFVASLQAVDGEAGCALMDEAAQGVLVDAHGAEDCVTAFPAYVESLPDAGGAEVGEVAMGTDLDGDTPIASVTLVFPGGEDVGALEMRQDSDDQWLATRLPGTTLGGAS